MKILFVGDIVGRPGRVLLSESLKQLESRFGPFDFRIANAENAAGGFGLTEKVMNELFSMGFHCLTSGNHIWDKKDFLEVLDSERRLLRPANYPPGVHGQGYGFFLSDKGTRVLVVNLQGRVFMPPIDCPFRKAEEIIRDSNAEVVVVDFHAEATSEKKAMGLFLDGKVSCVLGTHTHVQTADEQILPNGTAYITDVGMTGGHAGVIGMEKSGVMERFLKGTPSKFEVCKEGLILNAVVVEVDETTGKATNILRIYEVYEK
ncbi:MAG: 2,3-cyclic-nucleotide 2-phosphodiesterase [Thermovirga sp.]|nr:2,3-cyclic-nucleotide 2-phosphodiesterase [Thermovirga sp.]